MVSHDFEYRLNGLRTANLGRFLTKLEDDARALVARGRRQSGLSELDPLTCLELQKLLHADDHKAVAEICFEILKETHEAMGLGPSEDAGAIAHQWLLHNN